MLSMSFHVFGSREIIGGQALGWPLGKHTEPKKKNEKVEFTKKHPVTVKRQPPNRKGRAIFYLQLIIHVSTTVP